MAPDPARLYRVLSGLRHVRRFSRQPCAQPQNVAEHSYYVALLAGCFVDQLHQRGVTISRSLVLATALWHDAAEAVTGDLPHDYKRWNTSLHEAWEIAEAKVVDRLVEATGCAVPRKPFEDDLVTLVVKVADWVELLFYVASEAKLGNHGLDIASERIWALLLSPHFAVKIATLDVGASGWFADLVDQLLVAVPPPKGAEKHDPLSLLEGEERG